MNAFSNETCLNVKHQHFIFQHIVQIYLNTYWHTPVRPYERCDSHQTSRRPSLFSSTTLSHRQANFLHKTLVTVYWTYLRVNGIWAKSFCPQKMNNRMLFLLRDAFSGSVAIFIVYKINSQQLLRIKLCTKPIFQIFRILKINRIMLFCNLLIEQPS